MTNFLLLIIAALLGYMTYMMHKEKKQKQTGTPDKQQLPMAQILPDYLNKKCELRVKDAMMAIDVLYSATGTLIDLDDEWLMLEVETKKKTVRKLLRVDSVRSVKEIKG